MDSSALAASEPSNSEPGAVNDGSSALKWSWPARGDPFPLSRSPPRDEVSFYVFEIQLYFHPPGKPPPGRAVLAIEFLPQVTHRSC